MLQIGAFRYVGPYDVAVLYRDGLMIAVLTLCPLRHKNFMALELGRTLIANGSSHTICFQRTETKTWQPIELPFPASLIPALERYLDHYRPFLLRLGATRGRNRQAGTTPGGRLWVNQYGQALSEDGPIQPIIERTRARFGHHVNPHLFRDCAATTIAEEDPKRVRMSAAVLGHSDFRTTEAHYIVANTQVAGASYHDLIRSRRAASDKKVRPPPR
jgi:integrase/recombinase XerD